MTTTLILLYAIMALMLAGIGFLIYKFVQSVLAKRAYDNAELPDIYEVEREDEVLPDVEESGFSSIRDGFDLEDESSTDLEDEPENNQV